MSLQIIGIGGFLTAAALYDFKSREIPLKLLILFSIIGIPLLWTAQESGWLLKMAGILPGAALVALSCLTGETIGYADGWSVMLIGLYLGARAAVFILVWALFLSALFSIFLIIKYKNFKNRVFAFIPFLAVAFLLWMGKG